MLSPVITNYYFSLPKSNSVEGNARVRNRQPMFTSPVQRHDWHAANRCGELIPTCETDMLIGITHLGHEDTNIIVTYQHVVQILKLTIDPEFKNEKIYEWRTPYKLTSPVVYDKSLDSYVGVFHDYSIRMWKDTAKSLDEAVKYTFRLPIFKILTTDKGSFIIFRNGNCVTLTSDIEVCNTFKGRSLIKESSKIYDATEYLNNKMSHVCCLVQDKNRGYTILSYALRDGTCNYSTVTSVSVPLPESITAKVLVRSAGEDAEVYFMRRNRTFSRYNVNKNSWREFNFKQTDNYAKVKEHDRLLDKIFKNAVTMSYMGKGSFFTYGFDEDNESNVLILNLENHFHYTHQLEQFSRNTRIFKCGQFIICVDHKITVYQEQRKGYERIIRSDLNTRLMTELIAKHPGMLPILGLPMKSAWRRNCNK